MDEQDDEDFLAIMTPRKVVEPEECVHITFADMGIPSLDYVHNTVVGKTRSFSDINWTEWVYFVLIMMSIVTATGITIYRLSMSDLLSTDFTLCVVLLINSAFSIWYITEGILRERPSEIIIICLTTAIMLAYLVVNYQGGIRNPVKLAQLIAAGSFCPLLMVFGFLIAWVYYVSRKLVFRTVGANETLQTCYIALLVFQDILKFDLQLTSSIIVFAVTTTHEMCLPDLVLLSVSGVVTLVWFILGYMAMSRESKIGSCFFFLLSTAKFAYVVYKLQNISKKDMYHSETSTSHLACLIGALIIHLVAMTTGIIVFSNFGKGLKYKLHEIPENTPHTL